MGRNFDGIDIIFILLISTYLVALFVLLLWVILTKLEKMQISKTGKSRLSSNTRFDKLMNETIELYKKNSKKAISKIISLAYSHGVPFVTKYSSDYFIDNIKDLTSFVLFIPELSDKQDYEKLYKKIVTFNVQFYSYWIDKNNIEKSGFYFILK